MSEVSPKITPMMQQYVEIKRSLGAGTLLFYRLGDFYELFNEDAEIGSRILGITLTHRGDAPMAGIPYHAAESYINKLLKANFKIAICDQVGVPKPGKLVKRILSRILTPGTVISDQQIEAKHNSYLLAIHLSKLGLAAAWIEVSTGEFQVAFSREPDRLIPVLSALSAAEIILSENEQKDWAAHDTRLTESLQNLAKRSALTTLPDFRFDRTSCHSLICNTLEVHTLEGFGIIGELEQVIGPAGALLSYVAENLRNDHQELTTIKIYSLNDTMILDDATINSLELFRSSHFTRDGSLIDAIDRTITAAGARLLEQFFLFPLLNIEEIKKRQRCVSGFLENLLICEKLKQALRGTYDLSRILTRLKNRLKNPRELGAVRTTINSLSPIKKLLGEIRSSEIQTINDCISLFPELQKLLSDALFDELPIDLSTGGYIKDGYNAELDRLRDIHVHCKEWI
ncbi:MAG: DNA mismatch repair protein MutS, partial [Opitutales bacterium]|nr:DNA mismatch repair protein MutS [Opitutales bacterium]